MSPPMTGPADKIRAFTGKGRDRVSRGLSAWPTQLRLMLLSAAVGVVAGLGGICFGALLGLALDSLLRSLTGYFEPAPGAAPATLFGSSPSYSSWLILLPALGALVSGVIVSRIAHEAEGQGTDAMIESFHERGGQIRKRVPLVKIVASALTIGSGGSAGKEGPISQIGAGFGSAVATTLRLHTRGRRILVLAGAAEGAGGYFRPRPEAR